VNRAHKIATLLASTLAGWAVSFSAAAAPLSIANVPLFLPGAVPPLNMLVMGRDHTLYYEAYNDASDLNGDGVLDVGYKPADVDYFGYFDSRKCYAYGGAGGFGPTRQTGDKRCGGAGEWSGDFLNYLTTSRIDALRKVLYGGSRLVDSTTQTVLERSNIPQDAHAWGKEYTSIAVDNYDIRDYTPYSEPASGRRHLFANTTLLGSSTPELRVSLDQPYRIWEWVSIERPVADARALNGGGGPMLSNITDFHVRVAVCVPGLLEANCKDYTGVSKPTGLLQEFGEDDRMYFGLITGSYTNNLRGGALRKNVASITDEIDPTTGQFTATNGIIRAIDGLHIEGFGGNYEYSPGWPGAWITTRPIVNGEQPNWGNPIAEMLYETLRYFSDKGVPTTEFVNGMTDGNDAGVRLPLAKWLKPFDEYPRCSAPITLAISDVNPSYDTDEIEGSKFSSFSGDLSGFSAAGLGDLIWQKEVGGSQQHFIGESAGVYDGAPTPKDVSSFANIRGLAPEAPTKEGGYYSASASYFGRTNDLSPAKDDQKLRTYGVALASPLPRIEIPVGGRTVTLVPFAKSVGGCLGVDGTQGRYQPTNQIVDFYVEQITPTSGRFRVNFEDVEQGADHDMDAIAIYEYQVVGSDVQVTVTSAYAAGCVIQHMGYVISGTTHDGTYLVVRDLDTGDPGDVDYFLDTPPAFAATPPALGFADGAALPLMSTRTFTPGAANGATVLKDPLWFASKWGGFEDSNGNDVPDLQDEWDADADGKPDNYFLVTNALTLSQQLRDAFDLILSVTSSASAVATNSTRLDTETLIYQARFLSGDWTGQLLAYQLQPNGSLAGSPSWDAAQLIPDPADRHIFTNTAAVPGPASAVEFNWTDLSTPQQDALDLNVGGIDDALGSDRLNWLRGDQSREQKAGGTFRNRSVVLGDVINSDPQFVGAQNFGYEALPLGTPGQSTYQAFRQSKLDTDGTAKKPMLYLGANDGMLHGFDAATGVEKFAYVPSTLIPELNELMDPGYKHRYFVDGQLAVGDAYLNSAWASVLVGTTGAGGRTVFALDVTNPDSFDENDVLWEFTDPDLGYVMGQPVIARMADGTWVAVFGNGYNSDSQQSVLFIVRLADGVLLKKINTGLGGVLSPNGLAGPALLADGTRTIRSIFAGDLRGRLWKFDVSATTVSSWAVAYTQSGIPAPLFIARDANGVRQPITAPLEIGRHPRGGYMIYFGTGKFFETNDNIVGVSPQVQSFYGIWDKATSPSAITYTPGDRLSVLTEQQIQYEGTPPGSHFETRVTTQTAVDWDNKRGWYIDLLSPANGAEGERVVSAPILRAGRIIFPTLIPPLDPCGGDGGSWLMEMEAVSGSRLPDSPLDINEDGEIDAADDVTVTINGQTVTVPVSGVRSREGIIDSPAVVTAGEKEYKLASGTSGNLEVLRERGIFDRARGSWRQLR
jgi:type IV pilus assembly protein PilY1